MAGEWKECSLGDVIELKRGYDLPQKDRLPGDVPLVSSSGVTDTHAKAMVKGPGVVTGRYGTLGQVFYVEQDFWPLNTTLYVRDFKGNDPRFISYFLRDVDFHAYSDKAAVPGLNRNHLHQAKVRIPSDPNEQRAIAHILGTLDDKIELNRRQNETLEAMARALFKAWFVDFEPVRAKCRGDRPVAPTGWQWPQHILDLFPDRLVESELGEIPEGWRVFSFGDVAEQGKGFVNPSREPGERFTHYSLPAFDAGKMPVIEPGESIKSNKTPVPDGAVLVSKLNPHIPRIWLVGEAGNRAVCSTEFIVWTPKSPAQSAFVYCLASSPEFVGAMCQLVTGTSNSHQRVKPDQLREIRVFAGNENVVETFSKTAEPLMDQFLQNTRQSRILAQLRDTLLPKLISGELRVKDAEAFLKERGL
ncbi:type I restriction-modification system, S subunit, EcoA family [Methylococcus capsulatus str. Bath]|uniref:Type I restriction-modification system, S subunit, EcoA family n=1 Tax=Methylococcus capsulatus (strain ATCC 33009 / NCIMB 11132 / Bath) TaxID=243233 RepID=Q60AL4_METCA|nr:restriction endonuclease subunit S [Methylococcus capsulatus]AAU93076.1 type I restriction-modification system, S subunit, EcoA family [Methylococcus capsulatus str. Bath]